MASQEVQYLRCAASLGISRTPMYAAFLGICDALILNFFLCHPKTDFLRVHQLCLGGNSFNESPNGLKRFAFSAGAGVPLPAGYESTELPGYGGSRDKTWL